MKKIYLTVAFFATSVVASSQLLVNENGSVLISSSLTANQSPYEKFRVEGLNKGIYSLRQGSATGQYGVSIWGKSLTAGTTFSIGVRGESFTDSSEITNCSFSYGVMGTAGNAQNNMNFGVFGNLSEIGYGAGVYGTMYANHPGINVSGRYAGYFHGATKVNGNLTVTGAINGVLLGTSASSSSAITASNTSAGTQTTTSKLSSLSVIPYYQDAQIATLSSEIIKTGEMNCVPSAIEIQSIEKKHYALSADELEHIFPELVYVNDDGSKSINYLELIPLLIQSIRELNIEVNRLKGENSLYSQKNTTNIQTINESVVTMGQNSPNPFRTTTNIKINIPFFTNDASILIRDTTGAIIDEIKLEQKGEYTIDYSANGLQSGIYLYSLVVDGQTIETKRMIVTNK